MPDPGLATAADYSEALLTARRAKSLVTLLLALMLIGQIALFLLLRYDVIRLPASLRQAVPTDVTQAAVPSVVPTTGSATADLVDGEFTRGRTADLLHYLTGVMILGGIALSVVLALTLTMIGHVMLVGRLIGVGRIVSAVLWTLVLMVLLFPWQAFMLTDFHVAGALWTWTELLARYDFKSALTKDDLPLTILSWFRFVGLPVVALILVLLVQLKSNRGLRMALGEDELLNEMIRQS